MPGFCLGSTEQSMSGVCYTRAINYHDYIESSSYAPDSEADDITGEDKHLGRGPDTTVSRIR